MIASILAHDGVTHTDGGSVWMLISMIAFSLFLLAFAWALLRPSKPSAPTLGEIASERFAQGEIDADDFERVVRDIKSHRLGRLPMRPTTQQPTGQRDLGR